MGEIIKIEIDDIVVGLDDGSVVRVKLSDVNFIPQIGDKVKVFKADDGYLVSKIKEKNFVENHSLNEDFDEDDFKVNRIEEKSNVTNNYYINSYNKRAVNKVAYVLLAFFFGRNWSSQILFWKNRHRYSLFNFFMDFYPINNSLCGIYNSSY